MRIAHVIRTLDPAAGGPPMVATRLAAAQANGGHDVHLFSYAPPSADSRDAVTRSLANVPHINRVRRHDLPVGSRVERIRATNARRMLESDIRNFDVLHLHGVWDPILKSAALVARRAGVPYVVVTHGMLDPWSMQQKRWKKRIALTLGYRTMLNGCAFLHALNADEQRLIAPIGLRCPVEVIPNGIFLEEIDPLPASGSFYRSHPQLANRPYVLFLSRLHFKKGLDYLADAFRIVASKNPDAQLVVAGPDEGARSDFERSIAAAGLSSRVHVVGPIYGADKFAAMVDCACFCLPSRQEGFSVAVTEAMACGRPVVISDACHFPEVTSSDAGFVVPLDTSRIAEALLQLLGDTSTRNSMGERGRQLVQSRFTWPKIAELSVAAYGRHMTK